MYLSTSPVPDAAWSGARSLRIQTQQLSIGASSFHPVSGINYVRRRDVLVLSLSDGSFHVVHNLSIDPSWSPPILDEKVTTESLTKTARSIFLQAEPGNLGFEDVNSTSGVVSYDGSATMLWVHEYAFCICV